MEYSRWWRFKPDKPATQSQAETKSETIARINAAVQRRLISDVPLGFWLSGGIDSALVLSQAGDARPSFCAGFAQAEYDERDLAKKTAAQFNSPHQSFEVPSDVFKFLPSIIWYADEPFFDSSALPVYVLAQRTKQFATVALGGDGGDEAFAGYDRYIGLGMLKRYKSVPALMRKAALAFATWRHPAASRSGWDRMLRWLEKCRLMENANHHPYIAAMELFSAEQRARLYGDAMLDATDGCDARENLENELLRARKAFEEFEKSAKLKSRDWKSAINVLQLADIETYLPGDVLHKVDRMSMAHGVEVRSPFLDVDLLNWTLSLGDRVHGGSPGTKPLLRAAAAQLLPPEVAGARKRGFGVPLDDWFRAPLKKMALETFETSACVADKLFCPRYWETIWNEHQSGRAQHGERLYALLATEMWTKIFFSGQPTVERPSDILI